MKCNSSILWVKVKCYILKREMSGFEPQSVFTSWPCKIYITFLNLMCKVKKNTCLLYLSQRLINIAYRSSWQNLILFSSMDLGTSSSCLLSLAITPNVTQHNKGSSISISSALDGAQAGWIWAPSCAPSISSLLCNQRTWSKILYFKPESSISVLMGYRKTFFPGRSLKGHSLVFPR